jgi:hypothetical protein
VKNASIVAIPTVMAGCRAAMTNRMTIPVMTFVINQTEQQAVMILSPVT